MRTDPAHHWTSWQTTPMITRVSEYDGQERLRIAATQLDGVSATEARRVVAEWVEFFAAGPSGIRELEFTTRTPTRLFEALAGQTQLEQLIVKWGDYRDLDVLSGMQKLDRLRLGGATGVVDVAPLTRLRSLTILNIEGARRVTDYSPLGEIAGLVDLHVADAMWGPTLRAASLDFLRGMTALRVLRWNPRVDSLDYSPLLDLTWCEYIWLREYQGMRPRLEELASVPGIAAAMELAHASAIPVSDEGSGTILGWIRFDKFGRPRR